MNVMKNKMYSKVGTSFNEVNSKWLRIDPNANMKKKNSLQIQTETKSKANTFAV